MLGLPNRISSVVNYRAFVFLQLRLPSRKGQRYPTLILLTEINALKRKKITWRFRITFIPNGKRAEMTT